MSQGIDGLSGRLPIDSYDIYNKIIVTAGSQVKKG